jgi:SAM-dependent methyltransferase
MSYYRNQLNDYLQDINIKCDRVLDIGAGDNLARERLQAIKCDKYITLDIDEKYDPDHIRDLNRPMNIAEEQFDIIFCLEVFEYIWNPVQAHQTIYKLLKKKGTAYISYPFVYPIHNPPKVDYLRYTREGIDKLLDIAGFSSWVISSRVATKGKEALYAFYKDEGMHPRKGYLHSEIGYIAEITK